VAIEFLDPAPAERDKLEALVSRVIGSGNPSPFQNIRPGMPPHEVRRALEAIPLSDRMSAAARATTPRDREILRSDGHPLVLQALARNTNLSLDDARALASQPQALPALLEGLGNDGRWRQDDEIKLLLLAHPQLPVGVADALLAGLKTVHVRRLLGRSSLSPLVRAKVMKRLRQS
jgi:hypothetical protein